MPKKGYKQTEEHKKNLSKSHCKYPHESYQKWLEDGKPKVFCGCPCHNEIIIKPHHRQYGIPKYISGHNTYECNPMNNPESRYKLSCVIFSEERRKKISESNIGKHCSKETRKKMSDKKKNIPRSDEVKAKISQNAKNNPNYGMKNKHQSETSKEKISKNLIGKCAGEKHYNWHGGISFLPYCKKFNEILKESIRKRDDYICQMPECLCTQLESLILYKHSLNVHHIHYKKEDCDPDLIALCHKHNTIVNYNRKYWEEYFMKKLKERNLIKDKV